MINNQKVHIVVYVNPPTFQKVLLHILIVCHLPFFPSKADLKTSAEIMIQSECTCASAASCLSSSTLTSGQSAVCDCGSSASLSPASRPTPQTSFGPLTLKPGVKPSCPLRAVHRSECDWFMWYFTTSNFRTKIHRKGAPKPEVRTSSCHRSAQKNGIAGDT